MSVQTMGPKCGICDKAVSMDNCVEVIVIAHRGRSETPLGSMYYHMECYLDEQDGEATQAQKEAREARAKSGPR